MKVGIQNWSRVQLLARNSTHKIIRNMGLLEKLFGKSSLADSAENSSDVIIDGNASGALNEDRVYSISYGTRMPIDAIYLFIQRDYEQAGFDDAMCNADSTYKESRERIIKNELKRLFEQVRLRYRSDLREIEVHIKAVQSQGLMDTASALKARQDTLDEHLKIMDQMEAALDNNEPQMTSMISSYERGFLRGLAAKSNILLSNSRA